MSREGYYEARREDRERRYDEYRDAEFGAYILVDFEEAIEKEETRERQAQWKETRTENIEEMLRNNFCFGAGSCRTVLPRKEVEVREMPCGLGGDILISTEEIKRREREVKLFTAVIGGNLKETRALLQEGVNPNAQDEQLRTPLHFAVWIGHEGIVRALLKKNARANILNKSKNTPVHCAAYRGDVGIMELLLEKKIDINVKNCEGASPLICAAYQGHREAVKLLQDEGAAVETAMFPLHKAIIEGDLREVLNLLNNQVNSNSLDKVLQTPLHYAARYGHVEIAKKLIARGAEVKAINIYDEIPLHYAAGYGHVEIVEALIAGGADVKAKNVYNETPLHYAARYGHVEIAEALIAGGAEVDAWNIHHNTPLYYAVYYGQAMVRETLIRAGASPVERRAQSAETRSDTETVDKSLPLASDSSEEGRSEEVERAHKRRRTSFEKEGASQEYGESSAILRTGRPKFSGINHESVTMNLDAVNAVRKAKGMPEARILTLESFITLMEQSGKHYLVIDSAEGEIQELNRMPRVKVLHVDSQKDTRSCGDNTMVCIASKEKYVVHALRTNTLQGPHLVTVIECEKEEVEEVIEDIWSGAEEDAGPEVWEAYKEAAIQTLPEAQARASDVVNYKYTLTTPEGEKKLLVMHVNSTSGEKSIQVKDLFPVHEVPVLYLERGSYIPAGGGGYKRGNGKDDEPGDSDGDYGGSGGGDGGDGGDGSGGYPDTFKGLGVFLSGDARGNGTDKWVLGNIIG